MANIRFFRAGIVAVMIGAIAFPALSAHAAAQAHSRPKSGTVQEASAGATWLSKPQKLSKPPHLFVQANGEEVVYYKTGSDNGRDILLAEIPPDGPGFDNYHAYFLNAGNGMYELIVRNSEVYDNETGNILGGSVDRNVQINKTAFYPLIKAPGTIAYKGITLTLGSHWSEPEFKTTRKQVATINNGKLYLIDGPGSMSKTLHVQTFVLQAPNGIEYTYDYSPAHELFGDDGVPNIRWNNGTKNKDTYQELATGGCGHGGSFTPVLSDASRAEVTSAGAVSSSRKTVYEFKKASSSAVQALYDMSGGAYYANGESKTLTYQQFVAKHPLIMVKDALGRYVVLRSCVV